MILILVIPIKLENMSNFLSIIQLAQLLVLLILFMPIYGHPLFVVVQVTNIIWFLWMIYSLCVDDASCL